MTTAVDKLADKIIELGEKMAEPAAEAALGAARMDAISALALGGVATVFAVCLTIVGRKLRSAGCAADKYNDGAWYAVSVAAFLTSGIAAIVAAVNLFNPWVYVTLYDPSYWVAKRIIGL